MLDADLVFPGGDCGAGCHPRRECRRADLVVGYSDRVLPLCSGVLLSGPFTAGIADVSY